MLEVFENSNEGYSFVEIDVCEMEVGGFLDVYVYEYEI